MVRHLRCVRALTLRKGLQLIRLIRWIKNNDDEDYDGHDDHSVTNDNLAQSVFLNRGRSNVSQMHAGYPCATHGTNRFALTTLALSTSALNNWAISVGSDE